ncbi:MAG: hypothetical protein ABSD70_06370 [Terracidiphilus sp.]|jgi:hypothetical protein
MRSRGTSRIREQLGRVPGHASTGFIVTGLLVTVACVSGNAGAGRLGFSLGLIAAAAALGWAKLTAAGDGPAAGVAGGGSVRAWMIWAMAALVLLHCGLAWRFVHNAPPLTDCYVFQRDAVNDLLHGVDPYGGTRPDIYDAHQTAEFYTAETEINGRVQVGLQYPPVTLLSALPGVLMGDLRYGYIAAMALAAVFLFAAMPDARGLSLATVVLLSPVTFVVEGMSWTEPLVWMLLCATFYAALKRPRWLPLALGLFLASKQYNVLALPFLGYWLRGFDWRGYWRLLGGAIAVALVTMLPFAVWNFHALWHDLVWFHLAQPMRPDAVSFAVLYPPALEIGPLLVLAFIAWALLRTARRAELFPAAYAMAMLLLVATSKQAFMNYYFLIALCFLLAGAALWPERQSATESQTQRA